MNFEEIFEKYNTVAVYGMSRNPEKAANSVPGYLIKQGFKVIPINPSADKIHKRKAYESLKDIPEEIDILNVFRPSDEAIDVVKEAIERKNSKGDIDLIWLQLGIKNDEAKKLAEENGIEFIQDRCIYVEHSKIA